MTGIAEFNSPEFHSAKVWLIETFGGFIFNPAENDVEMGFNPKGCTGFETKEELKALGFDLRQALAADLDYIATQANAVVVLPGYEKSKGVAAELATAKALGLPIWYLRKNPDGSWYIKDTAEGIGPRKLGGVEYNAPVPVNSIPSPTVAAKGKYKATNSPKTLMDLDESARDKGLLPTVPTGQPYPKIEFTPSETIETFTHYKNNGEVRLTSATGGQKGSKPERYDLIPVAPLAWLARCYGKGAEKYDDNNWQKGYDWKLSYAAMQRHLNAFWGGEDFDPETGVPHLANAAWHCFTLMWFMENKPEYDSRAKASN